MEPQENIYSKKASKLDKYKDYLSLSESKRKKLISDAQHDKEASPNPQGDHVFPEINFMQFSVLDEDGQKVRLTTYRYPAYHRDKQQHEKHHQEHQHNKEFGSAKLEGTFKEDRKPKALILMFHGLNSHIGRGAQVAYTLAQHGFETVGFDYRGFGQSEGRPGYVHSLQHHIDDCSKFVHKIKHLYEQKYDKQIPMFCLGQSMGGLTSYYLTLTQRQLFEGAVLIAPALKNQVGSFLVGLTAVLKFLLPEHTRLIGPLFGRNSRNPAITEFAKTDPHGYKQRASLSTIAFLVKALDRSPQTFKDYRCPFFVIQGGCDKIVNPMASFQLFQQSPLSQEDKDILFYQEMWHDIWHEKQIYQINEEIVRWLEKRLSKLQGKQSKKVHLAGKRIT